jgi:RNA polymerase sigma-70 factor (ECF subfamily)
MDGVEVAGVGNRAMANDDGHIQATGGSVAQSWPQTVREFEILVGRTEHRLVQFAFCRLQRREDAEDVVQEVYVQAFRDREKYTNVDGVAPFLFRMVANRCTDVLRKRRREAEVLGVVNSESCVEGAPAIEEGLQSRLGFARIDDLLGGLPKRQAEVIRLRVHGDLPFEDVARVVGCSIPTVKSRFRYGIQKLRRAMKRQGGER